MDIIIVCHVEFGYVQNKLIIPAKEAISGVTEGAKNLAGVADKYGAKVTFAVCPEVVEYFPVNIGHEIGLHIHAGWEQLEAGGIKYYVGDGYLRQHCTQSLSSSVLKDYPFNEQLDMIKTGKDYLASKLGADTKSFIAGRWSINNDTVRALIETGFTHECSALPHSKPCHYDWSRLPRICMPYHPDQQDYQKNGNSPILMVPTSQVFPTGPVSPEFVPEVGISWLKACFLEYYCQQLPFFHMCLHSPCMTDKYFIDVLDDLLKFIARHEHIKFKFATEIREYESVNAVTDIKRYLPAINHRVIWKYLRSRLQI